jgi:KDO2-lipid IV(A) lauroyltransferase
MNLQRLLNSRQAGVLALRLSRAMPPRLGFYLADIIAARIAAQREMPLVKAIRLNQWVARGKQPDPKELDQAVLETISYLARSFYEIFHTLHNPQAMLDKIEFSPKAEQIIRESETGRHGRIVLGVHMGNFDLVLQAAAHHGLHALGLSLPKGGEAVEWQHQFRRNAGLEIMPTSSSSLRLAIERLRQGGTVLTGIEHPLSEAKYKPLFFGLPAYVPVHYVQLALKSETPIVLLASLQGEDGIYRISASEDIEMKPYTKRHEQLIHNAEIILSTAEFFIRQHPEQWTVLQPVWPEITDQVPGKN